MIGVSRPPFLQQSFNPSALLKLIIVLRVVSAQVCRDVLNLHAPAYRAFKIGKFITKPKHHFACYNGKADFSTLTDSAIHMAIEYKLKKPSPAYMLTIPSGDLIISTAV